MQLAETFQFLALTAFILWTLFAHPPRHLSQAEYGTWYRTRYLNGLYWRTFRRARKAAALWTCAHWWKGGCRGALQVHHRKWGYRWLYQEFWPHVFWFGTVVLCDHHHKRIHKRK